MTKHIAVSSSDLSSIAYDKDTSLLEVRFKAGGTYRYGNVPEATFNALLHAPSKGTFFYAVIRDKFPTEKVGK